MVTLFTTRILRENSEGRLRILDAGCGDGRQALFLARRNPERAVYGYDLSPEQIEKAERYKLEHRIGNVGFSIASHDDFQFPCEMDMAYTCESLVGDDEIPQWSMNPLQDSEEIVRRRLGRFNEWLADDGVYILTWKATYLLNYVFIKIAEECGFEAKEVIECPALDFDINGYSIEKTGIVFRKGDKKWKQ